MLLLLGRGWCCCLNHGQKRRKSPRRANTNLAKFKIIYYDSSTPVKMDFLNFVGFFLSPFVILHTLSLVGLPQSITCANKKEEEEEQEAGQENGVQAIELAYPRHACVVKRQGHHAKSLPSHMQVVSTGCCRSSGKQAEGQQAGCGCATEGQQTNAGCGCTTEASHSSVAARKAGGFQHVRILYGSQLGTARRYAEQLAVACVAAGLPDINCLDMAACDHEALLSAPSPPSNCAASASTTAHNANKPAADTQAAQKVGNASHSCGSAKSHHIASKPRVRVWV